MNYSKNKKYFSPRPSLKTAVIGIAVVAGLFFVKPLWGLLALLVVGAVIYSVYFGRPSDAEIDAQAAAMLADIKKRAFQKLGVEEEEVAVAKPIEFWGYEFGGLNDTANRNAWNIRGKDGEWRSSEVRVGGFYFSENEVNFYYRIGSLVSDASKEGTEQYFYKDIVSVKTETGDRECANTNGGRVTYNAFILRNAGGETTECAVNRTEDAEAAVNAFRALLKQKKLG